MSPIFYTLSLHDALPIFEWPMVIPHHQLLGSRCYFYPCGVLARWGGSEGSTQCQSPSQLHARVLWQWWQMCHARDRKSTRLNSSHVSISYAVFCLKKKK